MNDSQKKAIKLLWDFHSLREEHIIKLCDCTEKEINQLIASKAIKKDVKSKILQHPRKDINSRNVVAFDIIMEYLDRNPTIKKPKKYPINVSMQTNFSSYDIVAIKEIEIDNLFKNIDEISEAERVIIIIETKQYVKRKINTKRPVLVCTYSPLKIVDKIN